MSLYRFLIRLILWSVLPLVLLAAYLGVDSALSTRAERDQEARNLARNYATAVDFDLLARIAALRMLAASPLGDRADTLDELYREALGFRASFNSEVILAETDGTRRFDTRQTLGVKLTPFLQPKGLDTVHQAIETQAPVVGNVFQGHFTPAPLVALAVPAIRNDSAAYVVINVIETAQFQARLERVALPPRLALTLVDGKGEVIARRAPPGLNSATDVDPDGRFTVASAVTPWTIVLEIPRAAYNAPLFATAIAVAIAIAGTTLISVLGGLRASRRLGRWVASLAEVPTRPRAETGIVEIDAVRRRIDEAARRQNAAETAQYESEQRFRAIFEQAAVGMAMVAPDGRWLMANEKLCAILGYSQDELVARTFQAVTYAEDLHADLDLMSETLAGMRDSYAMEKRYQRKDGTLVWVNITVALVRCPDGTPDYFVSAVEDIERRKQAEAALHQREASLREAQRLAGLGSWRWDVRSGKHEWSEEIYRIYGRDPDLAPAEYPEVASYFTPESWARLAQAVEQALATGTSYECDAEVARSDGEHRWIIARGEPGFDGEGRVVELHGTVQDITDRKNAAEALRELNAHLEQRVEQRTAELTAANRELDAFAYAVSHDLRAPLRALSGFSQALVEDFGPELDGDAKVYLTQITLASRKMSELIEGILALSRITRGVLRQDSVNVSALATAILADLAVTESERQVNTEIEPGLTVHGDARMIEALMRNLLENAWKYSSHTAAPLIRVFRGELDGHHGICVSDNGAGFDMAHSSQLFEPFRRLHRQDEFPGIGIGLATVQRIVHRHGGEIHARAEPGKGACFCFRLADKPQPPEPQPSPTEGETNV